MTNLSRSGLNAFPAVVMHPRLMAEGGSHPLLLSYYPVLHHPYPTPTSNELRGSWQRLPPRGPQQVHGGQSCWSLRRHWSLGVCKHNPSWQLILLFPKPKPGQPRLPVQGGRRDSICLFSNKGNYGRDWVCSSPI